MRTPAISDNMRNTQLIKQTRLKAAQAVEKKE